MEDNKRTWCKYGDCSLEKLEIELEKLDELWSKLEKTWNNPEDIEDVYRVYPLLDITAALARKKLIIYGVKNEKYKVRVIMPTNMKAVDTTNYLYDHNHKFFNGDSKKELLADVVSTFLHASEYVYMDTRKQVDQRNNFNIYVFIKTDCICESCAEKNMENYKKDKINYRKTLQFIVYDDCICGKYVEVRSYINAIKYLLSDKIRNYSTQITSK